MSESTTVDKTTVDELTGKIVLLIEENRPWHETELMHRQMSAKVKHYVRYIRGKEFAREHGQRPQDTIVRLVTVEHPGDRSIQFLRRVGYELSKHGIEFESQVGTHGIPMSLTTEASAVSPEITEVPPTPIPSTRIKEPQAHTERPSEGTKTTEEFTAPEVESGEEEPSLARDAEFQSLDHETPELDLIETGEGRTEHIEHESPEPEYLQPDAIELEFDEEQTVRMEPSIDFLDESVPADSSELQTEETVDASTRSGSDARAMEQPSELEMLLDVDAEWEDDAFAELDKPLEPGETVGAPGGKRATRPTFFPEEEFGRALPDVDEVEAILMTASSEPAIIETSSGKRIRLDVEGVSSAAAAAARENAPSLIRAAGAAVGAALAGAIIWAGLSIGAGQGASPLALAIGLMVGMSVRLQGNGHTTPFRVVGVCGTIFGSLLGATLAGAALSAWQDGLGFGGILTNLSSIGALVGGLNRQFSTLDLISLALALYIAYKLSASKPSTTSS